MKDIFEMSVVINTLTSLGGSCIIFHFLVIHISHSLPIYGYDLIPLGYRELLLPSSLVYEQKCFATEYLHKEIKVCFKYKCKYGFYIYFQRYYGKSLPFGEASFTNENIGFLSIEQALADYAVLVKALKKQLNATGSAVFAFGGRYSNILILKGIIFFTFILCYNLSFTTQNYP